MLTHIDLKKLLTSIDGKGYPAYKALKGDYDFGNYTLFFDRVQSDPFASPSKIRISVSHKDSEFPEDIINSDYKKTVLSDFLTRAFEDAVYKFSGDRNGSGNSGIIRIDHCGQEVLERTSVIINDNNTEIRMEAGLPANGRRISGKAAIHIFFDVLPKIINTAGFYKNISRDFLDSQIKLKLDQEYLRKELKKRKLTAFIANGSVLPRESGISDKPLAKNAVLFNSPESLETEFELPNAGLIKGMGIPEGITLIVGGGYHGKSTLLNAIESSVYNHKINDGREMVITRDDAVKIRAEDGRNIEMVNITPFINNLPNNKDTYRFSTENASGSTSQAANVMEALEAGSRLLLIDEDTSATNFMIRDDRMKKLVSREKEPITPFVDKVRQLYEEHGVSSIIVAGGSGDYFKTADHVIMMDEYIPKDVTEEAKAIVSDELPDIEEDEKDKNTAFGEITARVPLKSCFELNGKNTKIKSKEKNSILYGRNEIDLSNLEQLVSDSQTRCLAAMLEYLAKNGFDDKTNLSDTLDKLYDKIKSQGLYCLSGTRNFSGKLALPRKYELSAAINRYRDLKIKKY